MIDVIPPQEWVTHDVRSFGNCPTCAARIEPGYKQAHRDWHIALMNMIESMMVGEGDGRRN